MAKIGIITLNGYYNYGNRLQNYALQEVLKSLGFIVETILVDNKQEKQESNNPKYANRLKKLREKSLYDIIKEVKITVWDIIHILPNNKKEKLKKDRTNVFKNFTNQYINETKYCISEDNIPYDIADRYDYFVVGSDQVWNPIYINASSIYFLTFAPKTKRISFSASFGITNIPIEYNEHYKNWLGEIGHLSVREDAGVQIIKDLTGRDAFVHVDPTLILTKDEWISISKKAPNKPKGKYLLTYFLGDISEDYKKQIRELSSINKLKVINLGDIKERNTYRTGPSEFIDYINGCSIFCTDSFHGAIFSILFEKPFIVYERIGDSFSVYSRLTTLINKFGLHSRRADSIKTNDEAFNIDFSNVAPILKLEREKVLVYLKNALDINNLN